MEAPPAHGEWGPKRETSQQPPVLSSNPKEFLGPRFPGVGAEAGGGSDSQGLNRHMRVRAGAMLITSHTNSSSLVRQDPGSTCVGSLGPLAPQGLSLAHPGRA